MTDKNVSIKLTQDEALILYDFLTRLDSNEWVNLFDDQAEQRVLWDLECSLEKQLVEPLQANYKDVVKQARNRIRDQE